MKIAVASNDSISVAGHVGRCKEFIIYEIINNVVTGYEIKENTFTHHRSGEQNHEHQHNEMHPDTHSKLINALKDCSHIIFAGGGWRLIEDLKANNIIPLLTSEPEANVAVKKFLNGELKEDNSLVCRCH